MRILKQFNNNRLLYSTCTYAALRAQFHSHLFAVFYKAWLIGTTYYDELTRSTFGHNSEEHPRSELVRVVRTGHKVEELREGVRIRNGHSPQFSAGRSQVLQQNVNAQVAQFTQLEIQNDVKVKRFYLFLLLFKKRYLIN